MHSFVNPTFPYVKWGFPGCSLQGLVNVAFIFLRWLIWSAHFVPVTNARHKLAYRSCISQFQLHKHLNECKRCRSRPVNWKSNLLCNLVPKTLTCIKIPQNMASQLNLLDFDKVRAEENDSGLPGCIFSPDSRKGSGTDRPRVKWKEVL